MVTPETLLTLAFLAAFGGVVYFFIHRHHLGERIRRTRILAGEAMRRRGITPADAAAAGVEHQVFAAVRRCETCGVDAQCRESLGASASGAPPAACPNSAFFDDVAAHKAAQEFSKAW
jgi:hypothetical protein